MGTAMLPVAFGTLLMMIWLGTPFYWGWIHLRGPRIIAADRQGPRIYPPMIPLCSRFDSVLFTPNMSAIASYGNFSRSPLNQ